MPGQKIIIIQTVSSQSLPISKNDDIALLLKYGGGTAAIILSISILLLAVAEIIKVLVPVMLQRSQQDTEEETNFS